MAIKLKNTAVSVAFATSCLLGSVGINAAEATGTNPADNNSDTLPKADAGECYAKVSVPAVYKTETIQTLVKQASEKIEITPAKYREETERVMIKEASTKLIPIEPVYEMTDEKVLLSPASRTWVRSNLKSDIPVSAGVMADLADSGIDVKTAKPGQCFYEFHKAATYQEVEDKVLVAQASSKLSARPARFSKATKQVMVKPATKVLEAVPTKFEIKTEKVLVEAAHREWKKGRGPIERINNSTGEIMCLVNVPARYEEIERQVVKSEAVTRSKMQPAEYKTINVERVSRKATELRVAVPGKFESYKRRKKTADAKLTWLATKKPKTTEHGEATGNVVCYKENPAVYKHFKRKVVKTPGSFKTVNVPAEYTTVKVKKLAGNPTEKRIPVPEVKKELLKRTKVSDARMEWRPVLCETNMTKDVVAQIQKALNGKGYPAGAVDGVLGNGTLRALEKFQSDKNLAQGGLTYATIDALGVGL